MNYKRNDKVKVYRHRVGWEEAIVVRHNKATDTIRVKYNDGTQESHTKHTVK